MHEFAIARDLLEVTSEEARRAGAVRVNAVFVRIGEMRMIDAQLIREAWSAACEGTICEGAQLHLETCPTSVECPNCGRRTRIDDWTGRCTTCASDSSRVVGGDELEMTRIDVELDEDGSKRASSPSDECKEFSCGASWR